MRMATAERSTPAGAGPGSAWRNPALRALRPVIVLFTLVLVVAALYFARAVLMPIALAGLLTFLLGPVADFLHRRSVPRAVAVLLVVVLAFTAIGGVGYVLVVQATSLADELPRYRHNIREKIADLRGAGAGGSLEQVKETVKDVAGAMQDKPSAAPPAQRVVVDAPPGAALWNLPALVGPWLEPLATAGLVIVLVIFMLLERQQLRNRIIRLAGYGRLTDTTKALDEAGQRISRYLLMQSLVNTFFGVCVGAGLWLIGVPYALLWGFLAGVLRFIPYAGPWIAAVLPVALSLAAFPGWQKPLLVLALFLALELFTSMVLETLLYAGSAGVSEVALLIAVAFWTWLWGTAGLLLATPLTVCLVVFAKHVPAMRFLTVLMTDDPPLPPEVHYYQRLLAGDQDEAAELVEERFKTHPRDAIYDDLLIPALNYLKRDREGLTEADEAFIARATHEIVEDVETMQATVAAAAPADGAGPRACVRIVGCAARDRADELALSMLRQVLDPERFDLEIVNAGTLTSEVVERVGRRRPVAVCVAALPPGGFAQARYLCKRLRARFPELRILVGRWGGRRFQDEHLDALSTAGADDVAQALLGTRDALLTLAPLAPSRSAEPEAD
ncbi:MAG: AI-2E family transporter [Candidatus Rokuibacteriota bacterium]